MPCDVFLGKFPFWNWTTFLLTKQLFCPKMTHGCLICSSPWSPFSFWVFSLRLGHVLLTLSKWFLGYHQGIEPVDDDKKLLGIPFWNWTFSLWRFFWNLSILELNHFFSHKTAIFIKNHLRLPNMLRPQYLWVFLLVYVCFFFTGFDLLFKLHLNWNTQHNFERGSYLQNRTLYDI